MKSERYVFPPFVVDTRVGSLSREAEEMVLRPKTFAVLCSLLERAGQLVSKEELLEQVWAGTYVAEGALTVCITELRKALGDNTKNPQFIATMPKRGYRFIATVVSSQHSVVSSKEEARDWRLETSAFPPQAPSLKPLAPSFVGRDHEMNVLRTSLEEALTGHGRLVLLAGEPGIGKTRTAEELANDARARHAQVLVGRCYDGDGAPPFWPWVQILRAYLAAQDGTTLQAAMGTEMAAIAAVLPEVRERLPALPTLPPLAPEHARFRFLDGFTSFLKNAATVRPLVLMLDDLHWADTPSLLLFQFLAHELSDAHILVLGTYRDMEVGPTHPLSHALGELARIRDSQTLVLRGLAESEVARFLTLTTTVAPSPALLTAIHRKTGGNPFFVTEMVHTLRHEGEGAFLEAGDAEHLVLPQRVRLAIERRLVALSAACRELLAFAATIGHEFSLPLLDAGHAQAGVPSDPSLLLTLLHEAVVAGFVTPTPRGGGQYGFVHALIRETVYAGLSEDRRVQVHRQIGEALERLTGTDSAGEILPPLGERLAELALHFFHAAPGGDLAKAITYALQAGDRAAELFAYEEAAIHYEHALQLLEITKSDTPRRGELLLRLAELQRKAGLTTAARETCRAVAEIARTLRQQGARDQATSLLARVALEFTTGFGGVASSGGVEDPFIISLLEEALVALGDEDTALRARTLSRLALEIYYSHNIERITTLSQEGVHVARRVHDTATLAYALHARHTVRAMPEQVEERLATATEIVRLATEAGDKELALRGQRLRLCDLLELGDFSTADREFPAYLQRAEELRQPSHLWFSATWRATRAWVRGNYTESEHYAHEALAIGQRAQDPDAAQCFTGQIFATHAGMRSLQGIALPVQQLAEHYTALAVWRSTLALVYAGSGAIADAQREFAPFAADDFTSIPRGSGWLITLVNLAQTCALLRDSTRAAVLYDLLLPYAHRHIVVQPALFFLGSMGRILGLLAATQARWREAEAHFEEALRRHREIHARPLVVLTLQQYVPMFFVRAQPGDWTRAMAILDQTVHAARELGMDQSEQRALTLKSQHHTPPPEILAPPTPRSPSRLTLVTKKEKKRKAPLSATQRDVRSQRH